MFQSSFSRDLTKHVLQRCFSKVLQLSSLHFPLSISSSYHLVTTLVFFDGLWAPMFHSFVFCYQIGTLCELVCEHLFFLFQKTSCFSSSLIGIGNSFATACISLASINDMKSNKLLTDSPWIFLKCLWAFIFPDYRGPISMKRWNFSTCLEMLFLGKTNCCKTIFLLCGMDGNDYFKE